MILPENLRITQRTAGIEPYVAAVRQGQAKNLSDWSRNADEIVRHIVATEEEPGRNEKHKGRSNSAECAPALPDTAYPADSLPVVSLDIDALQRLNIIKDFFDCELFFL